MKFLANTKVFAYIFYVIAIIFGIYTIMSMVVAIQTIMYTVTSGMYGSVPFSEMVTYFFTQAGPFLFDTCVLFFCGYAIQLMSGALKSKTEEKETSTEVSTENEPTSSYSASLNMDTTPEVVTDDGDEINFTTDAVPSEDLADVVEEDFIEEDKPVVDELEVVDDDDDVPVIENDSDLTEKKLDDLEEAVIDFDKQETEEGEGINDTML